MTQPTQPDETAAEHHHYRVGDALGRKLSGQASPKIVLASFPTDEGVRRNHGRPGAALAPPAIRGALYELEIRDALLSLLEHTKDIGDIPVTGDLEADQARLGEAIAP